MGSGSGTLGRRREPLVAAPVDSDPVGAVLRSVFPGIAVDAHIGSVVVSDIEAGDTLCRQGDPADVAWVLIRGRLRVLHADSDGSAMRAIADIGPGSVIGEGGLVDGGTRGATVVARRDCLVAELSRQWLADVVGDDPTSIGHLIRSLDGGRDRLETTERVIAVIPAGASTLAVDTLVDHLRAMPETIVVDAAVSARGSGWLRDLETSTETVVLLGDGSWSEWNDRAARIADRIVTLVDATQPTLHANEIAVAELPGFLANARTAVLVHPDDLDTPRRTRDLLDARPDVRHLHLRETNARDHGRVSRHLTGRTVALVVGGGGARSLAAIGTYRELRRRGIPIDAVTGSSAGAVLTALIAHDVDPDEMLVRARAGFDKVRDPTIPVASILRGRRLWEKLGHHLGDGDIEDTWIPFACTTTDLTDHALVEHTRGSLRRAVRASVSLPGVFPPVDLDGHLHVDGGILDNLPVRAARDLAPGAEVIAVDVSPPRGPSAEELPPDVSGAQILFRRLMGIAGPGVPSIATTMTESVLLGASRSRREVLEGVSCHIDLDLERFALLDFAKLDSIVDIGSRESGPIVDEWASRHTDLVGADEAWTPTIAVDDRPDPDLAATTWRGVTGALWLAVADLRFRLRRFVVAMAAAGVVLALLLLMTGVVNELDREPSVTTETIGATAWLLPDGINSPFTSNATFDESAIAATRSDGTIRPAVIARLPVTIDGETIDAILVGHADDGPGVPSVADGRAAVAAGEVAIASFAGARVGDTIDLGSSEVEVTGTLDGTTLFAGMPLVFTPIDAARHLVAGGRPVVSTLLVDGAVDQVPDGLHVLARSDIVAEAKGPVERPILTLHLVQVLLAIVAAMIIGAVVYLASLERTRDVAVLRAVGTPGSMLALGVAAQALVVAAVAAALAVGLEIVLAPAFPLTVYLTVGDFAFLVVTAGLVAVGSSYLAVRRTLRIDPSEAFAGAGG
ncbi:patatin-like phospholipase family protein [Actinospongicola halichondriae]|uniref:patatin-like phospholipase family protein n=1 Tax=Actinospongicola halichondriae TaxID=3236844 RepID=UPI003D58816D